MSGVFIPAVGSTLTTNDTNLYPIWSQYLPFALGSRFMLG